ncbi:MAG: M48 family metallopeptidase [Gammaproteobacteria bacterium]|nr:M48 family metallopeptidase [Gammaproteobacteria bacterium]
MDPTELIAVLLSWASSLSGYPYPDSRPEIEYREHAFFEQHACAEAKNCRAVAWYDNAGTIYLDTRLADMEDPVIRSVVVHELVHYLQDLSGEYQTGSCREQMRREQHAYAVQRAYLNRIAGQFAATYPVYAPCPEAAAETG